MSHPYSTAITVELGGMPVYTLKMPVLFATMVSSICKFSRATLGLHVITVGHHILDRDIVHLQLVNLELRLGKWSPTRQPDCSPIELFDKELTAICLQMASFD